jgi:hypothetical protein
MANSSKNKEALSPERKELFEALLSRAGITLPPLPGIPLTDQSKPIPLSFAQAGLWELQRSVPDSSLLVLSEALRISGRLNIAALTQAVGEIARRHESLRTTFPTREGEPVQFVSPGFAVDIPLVDFSLMDEQASDGVSLARSSHGGQRYDLARGPLFSVRLLVLAKEEYLLLLSFHHIICDGWSRGIFLEELSELYSGYSRGRQVELPALAVQYQDYARWQRGSLTEATLEEGLGYWKKQLSGELPVLELPSGPRASVLSYKGGESRFEIAVEVGNQLKRFCRLEVATPFMAMLAAWKILLTRYSGQEEILVGTIVTNRESEELQRLIGLLVNTVALKTDLKGNPTYREAVRRVKEVTIEGFGHRNIPFEKVVAEVSPQRDAGRHPVVEVLFVLEEYAGREMKLEGVTIKREEVEETAARYDLTLVVTQRKGGGYAGKLVYNAEIYGEVQMKLLAEAYQRILGQLLDHPDRAISAFYPFEV